jgi:outer membrane protein assembly factor BamB
VLFGKRGKIVLVAAGAALLSAPLTASALPAPPHLPLPAAPSCDWPTFGQNNSRTFAAPDACTSLSRLTAPTLHPKWFVNTSSPVSAQPVVVDGTVYVGTGGGTFYAVDAASGTTKWTYTVTDGSTNDYGKIVDSATVTTVDGKRVAIFGGGATLYVLDASDGAVADRLLAAVCVDPNQTLNPNPNVPCRSTTNTSEIESSPAVVPFGQGDTRVLVGMDYNETKNVGEAGLLEFNLQGGTGDWHLTPLWKYDPETRQTYTTDPIHFGGAKSGHACGDVWSSPTIIGKLAVFGVGNCDFTNVGSPPVTESVTAVSVDDGSLAWSYQPRQPGPAAALDLDFGATPNVLPNGNIGEGGKDGVYYSFKPAQASVLTPKPDWTSQVATASDYGGMIGSPAVGKANGNPAIFASTSIPVHTSQPQVSLQNDAQNPGQATGLHAIDATTGKKLWDAPATPVFGAASYAGGVVIVPDTVSFSAQAYDADTGALLWTFPTGAPPASPASVVGDSIYMGSGVDFGAPLNQLGGVWAFQTLP